MMEDPFDTTGQLVVYYEPDRSLGPRVVAQQSVFVICNPLLPAQHLKRGDHLNRDVLKNRGNSKFALGMFAEAHEDFEAAAAERRGSDTALAMGNCKVMLGEFETALRQYLEGAAAEPKRSAGHCRANAEQVGRILETLDGRVFRTRLERGIVFVEATRAPEAPQHFPLAGNQGNTGNTASGMVTSPGGEGYEGGEGFGVSIGSPAS